MNKLFLLILLIPMFSFGDDQPWDKDPIFDPDQPYELVEDPRIKNIKYSCSIESGYAKNEYSAKKIYETCLEKKGIEDK